MKYFLRSLLIGLLCLSPLGTDATQRVAALISPQAIDVDLGFVQVGNVGNLSVMGAPSGATFSLLTNPGGHFSIVGTEIVAEPSTPAGQYSISVQAAGTGFSVSKIFVLNFSGSGPSPAQFSVGINLVGGEAQFPNFATTAQINYHANRLTGPLNPVPKFRFTLGWSRANSSSQFTPNNNLVGVQPVAFGPLDTTSTVYNGPAGNGTSYVAQMNHVISDAMAAGGQVLLDIHTFGGGPGGDVGSGACPFSCFADLWGKIADYYVHVRPDLLPGIYGFDLMNEWTFIDSSIAFNGNQAAITAARANGYTGPIYIEGVNFTSAWNWTSGTGQSFNNSNLYQLVDPLNNLISSAHMYPDPDDSGATPQSFAYSVAIATAGSAPTGLDVNPTIGVTRTSREWQPWTALHSVRPHIGEYGTSNDNPWRGGAFDSADWNVITRNLLTYLKANNIEISLWASGNGPAGYGPNGYAYSLDPFNVDLSGNYDFTATGVQEPVWAVIDEFTGYTGPQPTAYALFQPGLTTPALYTTVGSPSQPFTIYYGGKITSPVTITPHDTLADFTTSAAGTFIPATITLAAGENALATFTYTPSQATTIAISTTNNRGWSDPPKIGISSTTDNFATLPNTSNICDLRRVKTTYIGPAVREIAADGVSQQDFYFNNRGDLPRQALYDYAASTAPKLVRIYNQTGDPNGDCYPLNFSSIGLFQPGIGNPPLLNLNPSGYPEVSVASTQWMGTQAHSGNTANHDGKGLLTLISRVNGNSVFLSQSNFSTQFRMATTSGFDVAPNAPDSFVSFGALSGYNHLTGTYSNLYGTNNQKAYVNGSAVGQASPGQFTFNSAADDTFINGFRFGGQNFTGAWTSQIITYDEASAGTVAAFNSSDVAYYSTPLPDTFVTGNLPPVVSNTPAAQTTVLAHFFPPFGMGPNGATNTGTVVTDPNPGGTDSAVITITGDAGATITGSGITGSNPYSIASTTPAALTSILQLLQYQSSSSVGTVGTVSLVVTSSSMHFATVSTTVTVGSVVAETAFAAPAGCTFTPPTYAKGVNISDGGQHYPAGNRFAYIYPQTLEVGYFAGQGMTAIRFPTTAGRLQPWAYRPIDPVSIMRTDGFVGRVDEQAANAGAALGTQTNLIAIKALLDQACSLNMYVLLEPHDFGGIFDNRINAFRTIGIDAEGTAMFRDWWTRLATLFKNYPNIIFQEENEPTGMTGAQWQAAAALVTSDIAAVTTARTVMVQGTAFDSCLNWSASGSAAAWSGYTPPAGLNVVFECHQYLDPGNSGTGTTCITSASARMATFDAWLVSESKVGFVGEVGYTTDSSCMTSATVGSGPDFMAYLTARDARYMGWTWWLGGSCAFEGSYIYTVQPTVTPTANCPSAGATLTNKPQMQTLINNLIFLLKRDIDPASNDNSPMWLEKAV